MDYSLREVLYTGRETRIVRGTHSKSGAQVVLKLPRSESPTPQLTAKLRSEYAMLRALEVPGVIRAIALESHEQGSALALEPWGETSLERALSLGELPVATSLRLGVKLAQALGHVHRRGIIHRDVKPQNILVDAERRDVRLIDFGIATRWTRKVEAATAPDALAGTLAYMAPEQTGRMDRAVDTRADLYALGATLYQMLTGRLPFETDDALELIHAHIAKVPIAPHMRAPARQIPPVVSAIVLRLMVTSPEHRYQTAEGAAFDLERALRALEDKGVVEPFELATRDWADRIRRPSRLFGREAESAVLERAFEVACGGATRLAIVAGPSGVGKSALVLALRDKVRERGGLFAPGKFDLLQRSTPYSALAQALRSVVRRRLADPSDVLSRWASAWRDAAGPNGQILVDLMPELVHVIGEPKPLVEVGPIEAKNRFQRTVQRFLRTLAAAEHPLCLFIDDLQWADPASLVLLQQLLTDPDNKHLLVVGAYRNDEVGPAHPLHGVIEAVGAHGTGIDALKLSPLDEEALAGMVADMLDRPAAEVALLSQLVKTKTDGSPFFVGQFLQALHEHKLLERNPETGAWRWHREAIESAGITDNVVMLLTRRLSELSPGLQRVLQTAACVGARFELNLLADLEGQDPSQLSATLEEAVREGLLLHEGDDTSDDYSFVHDRVQQAAYEARTPGERVKAHLSIGRQLRERYKETCADDELFATLYHRNRAIELLTDDEEKVDLAAQNLRAGKRATTSTAYAEAVAFLTTARSLLGEGGWSRAPELTFDIQLCMAEATTMAGRREEGDRLFQDCLDRARDDVERGRVVATWSPLLHMLGQSAKGAELGMEALARLGYPLPRTPEEQQGLVFQTMMQLEPALNNMTLEKWKDIPLSTDPNHQLRCRLLEITSFCAALGQPTLAPCCHLGIAMETLRHGHTKSSATGCAFAADILTFMLSKLTLASGLVDVALASFDLYDASRATALFGAALASTYLRPLSRAMELYRQMAKVGREEGALAFADIGDSLTYGVALIAGAPLPAIAQEVNAATWLDSGSQDLKLLLSLSIDALSRIPDPKEGPDAGLRAVEAVRRAQYASGTLTFYADATAALAALHLGLHAWAVETAMQIEPAWPSTLGNPSLAAFTLVACVGTVHAEPLASPEARESWSRLVGFHGGRLAAWAEQTPETFLHMRLLFDAGKARLDGQHDDAERLYDAAVEDARKNGFRNDEALALRLAGEHRLSQGKLRIARALLREAVEVYSSWGALAAASRIRARYPDFFPTLPEPEAPAASARRSVSNMTTTTTTTSEEGQMNARLDVASVLRAAQALSGDRVLSSLVGRMLRLLTASAGAGRAVLALSRGEQLGVQAQLTLDPEFLEVDLSEPADTSSRLPGTLVQYVARSKEPVVLGQASSDSRFDEDPYLRAQNPASVLAVPLVHQGRLSGVMYLEHQTAANAFPEARVELVTMLASQAATAVENANLYAELAASNVRLEQQVQERTAQLKAAKEAADAASQAKSDFLSSMSHELRTPLNGILGYAQILERAGDVPAQHKDGVRTIRKSGEHLLTLINDVLDLAKIEAGRLELVPRDIQLPSLVRTVVDLCRVRAEQKHIFFEHEQVGPELIGVHADEKRLMQVLLNLIGNAIKFTERGGVTLRVEVLGEPLGNERIVRFQVTDTGVGIAPEHLSRIFEPFEQVGDQSSRSEGTGLGLAITRQIVERMGGSIEVQSDLGRGSTFTVTLALSTAVGAAGEEIQWENITGYLGDRRTILVVDDNAENRALIRDLLSPIGFDVIEGEDSERALSLAVEHRPALIVMDLAMPTTDGFETTRRLRRSPATEKIPVLASSASISAATRQKSLDAGCNGFLPKPVQARALFDALRHLLGVEWLRRDALAHPPTQSQVSLADLAQLTPPPREDISLLLDLAMKGRPRRVLDELQRMQDRSPEIAPWALLLRPLVQKLEMIKLREILRAQLDAGARAASESP